MSALAAWVYCSDGKVCESAVACPLSKDAEDAVTGEAITARPIAEERAVVPPASISAVGVQELFILLKLKLHPYRLGIAVSVPFGKC